MSFFAKKNKNEFVNSEEYTQLFQMFEKLRIRFESLEIELALYKKKLRASKGIPLEEDDKKDKNLNSMLLPDI